MIVSRLFPAIVALSVVAPAPVFAGWRAQAVDVVITVTAVADDTGAPIPGARWQLDDNEPRVAAAGTFEIAAPPGRRRVRVSADGYRDAVRTINVRADVPRNIEIRLERLSIQVAVEVVAPDRVTEAAPTLRLEASDVFSVAGGLDNVFRTLQTLPGVAAPDDFGGRLSVRGGGPDQNLTIMDGVEIHNPYRIFGVISAFNPETVERFELTAGGFGARHGDRLSSLLVVDNRAGSPAFGGYAAISATDANVVLEGGLPGGTTWLLTGRRTYYDLVAARVSDNDFPSFGDLQGRLDVPIGGGRLTVSGVYSREGADLSFEPDEEGDRADAFSSARNDLISARYSTSVAPGITSRTIIAGYRNTELLDFDGRFRNEGRRSNVPDSTGFDFADVVFTREVEARDVSLRQEIAWSATESQLLDFGFEVHFLESATRFMTSGDRNDEEPNGSSVRGGAGLPDELESTLPGTRVGIWVEDAVDLGDRLRVTPGLRFDWSEANGRSTLSPRLALELRMDSRTRLRLAGGLYTQSPGYEKLLQSDYFIDLSDTRRRDIRHQRSIHAILGLERRFGGIALSVEGYFKRFNDLIVGRLETEAERQARISRYAFPAELGDSVPVAPIITSNPSNGGEGTAYGLDILLTRASNDGGRFHGWLSYSLGRATQSAYGREYSFDYDRRHAATLVVNARLARKWELGITGRVSSGFPRTPPLGLRVATMEASEEESGRLVPATDPAGNLVYAIDYGDVGNLNSGRLPTYSRVDARLTFRPGGTGSRWEAFVEVLNALDRDNAGALEPFLRFNPDGPLPIIVESPDQALPLLPSFGVRFRF